jgi:hypothetical protein
MSSHQISSFANGDGSQETTYEVRVGGRFKMDRMIGSGSFGEIYAARDM